MKTPFTSVGALPRTAERLLECTLSGNEEVMKQWNVLGKHTQQAEQFKKGQSTVQWPPVSTTRGDSICMANLPLGKKKKKKKKSRQSDTS